MKLTLGPLRLEVRRDWENGCRRGIGTDPKWGRYLSRNVYLPYGEPQSWVELFSGRSGGRYRKALTVGVALRISDARYRRRMGFAP